MKRTGSVLLVIAAASWWCQGAFAQHVTSARTPVLAQNLTRLESTGKVKAALWTLRNDSCTLQLVLPWGFLPGTGPEVKTSGLVPTPLPEVRVWLLTANGAQISATTVSRPDPARFGLRTIAAEFSYSFPRWANGQAVAAAIRIGDDYYIEKLETLADQPM